MKRLSAIFSPSTTALIPYVMVGDPDIETTEAVIRALAASGVDAIELGVPYGDPLADGPTIAAAGARALANGVDIDSVLDLASRLTQLVPIVLFTYANPLVQYGVERFAQRLAQCGIAGAIVPDIPLEESGPIGDALRAQGVGLPLLIAPTTPLARAQRIAERSDGFIYLVSRLGVTGAAARPDGAAVCEHLTALRSVTSMPIAVGFGITNAADVAALRTQADGVIVGSALLDAVASRRGTDAAEAAMRFIAPLRSATRA